MHFNESMKIFIIPVYMLKAVLALAFNEIVAILP